MSKYQFEACKAAIMQTQPGRERNMYAFVRDMLIHSLGHTATNVLIDTQSEDGSGAPDLCIRAPTGLSFTSTNGDTVKASRGNGAMSWSDWAVFEVKDEPGAFRNVQTRELIFAEKAKYIGVLTDWFVMVDPEVMVARPVTMRSQLVFDPRFDIVLDWASTSEDDFKHKMQLICHANAGVSRTLQDFRDGDESKIAVVKLRIDSTQALSEAQKKRLLMAQGDFFDAVNKSTQLLHHACTVALSAQASDIARIQAEAAQFQSDWGAYNLSFSPFRLSANRIDGAEAAALHDKAVAVLRSQWLKTPVLAKLALQWLPAFHERMGSKKKDHHFAIETANLVLARILLIRFFEDHGFFGAKKYVCNGGIQALQQHMRYYDKGYELVLRQAYEKSHEIYASVFDEMDLDWVLGIENEQLSRSLEVAMMLLSRFDFTTVKGDVLTGIYDRFLDAKKRKEMGEFYTPPSIARYMVRRLGLQAGDKVIDPACGSGTFLLEAYQHMVGDAADSGTATESDMRSVLDNLYACDLNPFSATIAQVQMLWHLLPHRQQFFTAHFPEIHIADRQNSLQQTNVHAQHGLYAELNQPVYSAVIGNPPYVRPERNTQALTAQDAQFFTELGSTDKNLFGLFIYKALRGWCRPQTVDAMGLTLESGYLAFVVPLSFCDNDDNAALRRLFQVGGRFRLVEIIDMEVIAPFVFDAAVNPIVLIAQNRPAQAEDKVTLRLADERCIVDRKTRLFDLDKSTRSVFDYAEVWTEDGNILTRLTADNLAILAHISALPKLESVAQPFWTGKKGASIVKWQIAKPKGLNQALEAKGIRWEQQEMIRRGAVFRNMKVVATQAENAYDFYKGENISAGAVEGNPVESGLDIDQVSDSSMWRFRDILPARGFAFLQISLGITAAAFDPKKMAFLDTATLFFPQKTLGDFPFDLVVLSRIYQYYYGLALRQGAVSKLWSHLYPRNLRQLPWTEELTPHGQSIEALRPEYERLCRAVHSRRGALLETLSRLGCSTWGVVLRNAASKVQWGEGFDDRQVVLIDAPKLMSKNEGIWRIILNDDLLAYVDVSHEEPAQAMFTVLTLWQGERLSRDQFLTIETPQPKQQAAWQQAIADYDAGGSQAALDALLDKIDACVGSAFGLTAEQVTSIQLAMKTDAFLRHIKPNLPFAGRTQRGLSTSLAETNRYAGEVAGA